MGDTTTDLSDRLKSALDAPTPGAGSGKPPVDSSRLREALGLDKIDAKLAGDDANLDALKEGMSFPKLTQPPPQDAHSDPFQAFGQPAMYLAIFGSLLTRNPLASAVNAGAGVLKNTQAMDSAQAQRQYEEWKVTSENSVKLAQYEMNAYKAALSDKTATLKEKEVAMRTAAAVFKNPNLQTILDAQGVEGATGYVKAYEKHLNDVVSTQGAAAQHIDDHMSGAKLIAQGINSGNADDQANALELLAKNLNAAGQGKGSTASARQAALTTSVRLESIAARLRDSDPAVVKAAQEEAATVPEVGPGIKRVAPRTAPLSQKEFDAVAAGIRREHPDWTDDQVTLEANQRIAQSKHIEPATAVNLDTIKEDVRKDHPDWSEGRVTQESESRLAASKRAPHVAPLAQKEFDAVAADVRKAHPDWSEGQVTQAVNAQLAASKRDPAIADREKRMAERERRLANSLSAQQAAKLKEITAANPGMSDKEFGNAVRLVTGRNELSPAEAIKLDEYQGHAVEGLDVGDTLLHTMEVTPMAVGVGGMVGRPLEAIGNWLGNDTTARNEFVRNLDRMLLSYSNTEQMTSGRPLAAQMNIIKEIIGGRGWGETVKNTADAIHDVQNELYHRLQRVDAERDGTYSWKTPLGNLDPVQWRQRGGSSSAPDVTQFDSPQ
jgi:hypothetical protein